MTTYYVGMGGNDSNDGLSWAQRKLTLNGAEDIPVAAGDTVYVAPGTYRETLTCDTSGTAEAGAISYIGDYDGSHTTGTKGVVRITGSDNDTTIARQYNIICAKSYRTFTGFNLDSQSTPFKNIISTDGTNITVTECFADDGFSFEGTNNRVIVVRNCYVPRVLIGTSSVQDHAGASLIENCILIGGRFQYNITLYHYGIVVKNCIIANTPYGIQTYYVTTGNNNYIYNSLIYSAGVAINAQNANTLIENYNNLYLCVTARQNVEVGANSTTYPILFDSRWFFEMISGGSMLSPYDLSFASQLINVAGTSPTTADMRGTGKIGDEREWGALEYDPNLDIEAGSGGSGGAVRISPVIGRLG